MELLRHKNIHSHDDRGHVVDVQRVHRPSKANHHFDDAISGLQGTTAPATVTGANLAGATTVTFTCSGVTATIGSGGTSPGLSVNITISPDAAPGPRSVTVTADGIKSAALSSFTVTPSAQPRLLGGWAFGSWQWTAMSS